MASDSMNARISANGQITEVQDISMDDLLALVDEEEELVSEA